MKSFKNAWWKRDESPVGIQLTIWDWMIIKDAEEKRNESNCQARRTDGKGTDALQACCEGCRKDNKNQPELLAVSGGVLIVAAFGWAAVGLKDTLVETSDTVKAVEESYNAELEKEDLTEEQKTDIQKEFKHELTKARFKGVMKVGKKFVLPTMTLVVGMGLGTKGFKVLKARNVVLGTALKGTQEAYKFYRENVREDLGKEADLKYARGIVGE